VNRVGIRMYITVGAGGAPPANFIISSLTARRSVAGKPSIAATVRNTGQSTLAISGRLTLSRGPDGLRAGPFAARLGQVMAPGVTERLTVPLSAALPRGPWRADLELTSGLIHRSSTGMLTFPRRAGADQAPPVRGIPTPALVIIMLLAALLVCCALALVVSRRRIAGRRTVRTAAAAFDP
jgi:hypothetical protein